MKKLLSDIFTFVGIFVGVGLILSHDERLQYLGIVVFILLEILLSLDII